MMKYSTKLQRKEYMRKWRKENADYFIDYYKKNKEIIKATVTHYRKSTKGKVTIRRYEQTEKRKASKRAYQKTLRDAKKLLESLKKRGKI